MALTAGFDEFDHLVMGVVRDVPPIDEDHLVALIEARHTQVSLRSEQQVAEDQKTLFQLFFF